MTNEIIIDVGHDETRVALLEDKELVELYFERSEKERLVGNIYRGKICSVLPGMQAAFIDIGYEKNAFLYVDDIIPQEKFEEEEKGEETRDVNITDVVSQGQEITIQVIKEPIDTKGPRVSSHITLPGRYLVLLPNANYIGISRRIEDPEERERLKAIAEKIKPESMGMIVRTAAEGIEETEFVQDVNFLTRLWSKIKSKEESGAVPRILHKDLDLIYRVVRDMFTWNIDKLVINDRQMYTKVLELVEVISPALRSRAEYFNKEYDIFEYYQLKTKLEKALDKKVWLKCGGYLIIDQTEALTVIDVNTGKYVGNNDLEETVLKTNLEAAKEIAKQLRLRDIGGIIIIDFIDMVIENHRQKVIDTLKNALKKDRTRTMVSGITSLGLVEMTRKKVRQKLSAVLNSACPYCNGTGMILSSESVARNAEREIGKVFSQSLANAVRIEVHPEVAQILLGADNKNIEKLESKLGKKILVKGSNELGREEIRIKEIDNDKMLC
jgi:ribonuclease G